ncbi:hypothetical protein J2Y69_001794 [Microbacterium resistens]|uniref:Hydrolase n=1 Tax=Microbacterium resistens TaxID=156977 RepID=A0ABU1SC73_9MICO|nr:hydrolase [Microbacterium resistens]MDR6867193.1 hypothetical protein [Microbacterium resistens]
MTAPSSVAMRAAAFFDGTTIREGRLVLDDRGARLESEPAPPGTARVDGLITGRPTDHHVHLQLVDAERLGTGLLGRVVDLGAEPSWIRATADRSGGRVAFAGAFLTPPGGYPSDRSWAPAGSVREVGDAAGAAAAVAEMRAAGASVVKVASNLAAGPVFDDDLLRAIVDLAAAAGLPVVVHAEGPGQAQRVARLGAACLAHAPFTERLTDDEIVEQAAAIEWISTLAIHSGEALRIALDNVRRFHAAGGILRYGTDMGNGRGPVDLRVDEIDALRTAGIEGIALLRTLALSDPLAASDPLAPDAGLLILPDGDPARARRLTPADALEGGST